MFWPQSFWEWIVIFAICIFIIKTYRSFTDDNKEENIFTPLMHIGKRTKQEFMNSPNLLHKISKRIIQGNDRKKK